MASVSLLSAGSPAANVEAGLAQREKSWYFLFFQFPGIAERWLSLTTSPTRDSFWAPIRSYRRSSSDCATRVR
ncbi:hypothetical protein [Nocardia sp. GCM10030253]|uniref:hypothetical protein n=1 Tax=Nocardia sp. GCM10030253 TaxID=3273404 RepID=UPI003670E394